MRDVAALSGTSIKTVSRVVNGQSGVGPDLARRVNIAAASLGFRPNTAASALRRGNGRSSLLGVLLEDLSHPFDAALLRAIEEAATARGFLVLAGSDEGDQDRRRHLLGSLAQPRVDGIVAMAPGGRQDTLAQERGRGMPMVLVDRPATFERTDSVTTTHRLATQDAVRGLAGAGHRRIAYLGDRADLWTSQERRAGYLQGLAMSGVRADPSLDLGDLGPDHVEEATTALLDGDGPPTAFFTSGHLVTVGAVRRLHERGLARSTALIGFEDFPLADVVDPGITVVRQDVAAMGRAAADLVLARIDGDESEAREVVVPSLLVRRGSGEIAAGDHSRQEFGVVPRRRREPTSMPT